MHSPLFEPRERASHGGHVQYRSQSLGFHNGSRITLQRIESRLTGAKSLLNLKSSGQGFERLTGLLATLMQLPCLLWRPVGDDTRVGFRKRTVL